jgi:neopullulanase
MWQSFCSTAKSSFEQKELRVMQKARRSFILRLTIAAMMCSASVVSAQSAPEVLKVEPPNWWAGHMINPVRLLVRGRNLNGARVTATRNEAVPSAVVVNPAGTYLFVSVQISPAARPGAYPLTIETPVGKAIIPFQLLAPLNAATHFLGINQDDVIYLIMPDRFSNGDATNDAPMDAPTAANDRKNARAYHGGDLRGIINRLPYLKELGVTALWLTPWVDNWNGVQTCDKPWCPSTYYHGYHTIDYYGVEDRFGGLETLRELIERAHLLGLKVIQDQVANHIGSRHPWASDPPLDNWFHGTREQHLLNEFRGDLLLSPHATAEARRRTLDGWFANDMPDMNQDEPEVARYEIQNALWWVGITGIDGIRQDTIQYMPRAFIRDLNAALHRQYPQMWMVGEVFDRDPAHTAFFMGGRTGWDHIDTQLDAVFDFPLWQTSLDVFTGRKPVRALRDMLKYDGVYPDATRLVTMASNHDVRRFSSLEGATVEGEMLHVAFTLTVRGTPQLYYGDEIGMAGADDPDNRRDFPGGWPGDARNAFEATGRTASEQQMYEWTRDWIRLRREHAAVRRGQLIDLAFNDDVYVYGRKLESEIIIIGINRAAEAKAVTAPAAYLELADGARGVPLLGAKEPFTVSAGTLSLTLPARTAVAYKVGKE